MISDEPDEDADALGDDTALEIYMGGARPGPAPEADTIILPDWPCQAVQEIGIQLDADTLAWFRTTYADWPRQMRSVLRAWVISNTSRPRTPQP
jgi:uncharacterized protein (DUF4415 family)